MHQANIAINAICAPFTPILPAGNYLRMRGKATTWDLLHTNLQHQGVQLPAQLLEQLPGGLHSWHHPPVACH